MLIRELRKRKNLTQSQLAKLVNVDQTAISQWETGRTKPTIDNLVLLSNILDCEIKDILDIKDYSKENQNDYFLCK